MVAIRPFHPGVMELEQIQLKKKQAHKTTTRDCRFHRFGMHSRAERAYKFGFEQRPQLFFVHADGHFLLNEISGTFPNHPVLSTVHY